MENRTISVRMICQHVGRLIDANPRTANTEVVQHLRKQMDCFLRKKMDREVEETFNAILLELDKVKKEKKTRKMTEND